MQKKRLILLSLLLAASIAGQILLRPCLGESNTVGNSAQTAADATKTWNSNTSKPVDNLGEKLTGRFIIMLGFVTVAGIGVWWFLKKMNTPWLKSKNGRLELIETMHLGPRKAVHILRAGKKQLLVASSSEGIHLLCNLTADMESPCDEIKS